MNDTSIYVTFGALAVLIVVMAIFFLSKLQSLKLRIATAVTSNNEINAKLIEQTALCNKLQEFNTELHTQVSSLEQRLSDNSAQANEEKLALVAEVTNLKATTDNLQSKLTEREEQLANSSETYQKDLKELKDSHEQVLSTTKNEYEQELKSLKEQHSNDIKELKAEQEKALLELKSNHASALKELKEENDKATKDLKAQQEQAIKSLKEEQDQTLKTLKDSHQQVVSKLETQNKANIDTCTENYEKTIAELKSAHTKLVTNNSETASANITKLESETKEQKETSAKLNEQLSESQAKVAALSSDNEALNKMRIADTERFKQSNADLEHRLNTLGEKLLKERSESLQTLNTKHMEQIIDPLKSELNTFRQLVTETQKTNSEQAGQLKNELNRLQEAQKGLTDQAENLSKALMQGSKTQGMWGEHQLELVLESAGLEQEANYLREVFATNDNGERGRADVLIRLPQEHGIVIDAKCSLTAYTEYMTAVNESNKKEEEESLARHISSVKAHIDELSKKDYPSYSSYGSPSFVFMFVPIDHALGIALRSDDKLYMYAQSKNIYLVSPSSLIPALRIVGNLWVLAHQGEKFKLLAKNADRIYQKCSKVCNDYEAIMKARLALDKSVDAMGKTLCTGQGNLKNLLNKFASDAPALTDDAIRRYEHDLAMSQVDEGAQSLSLSNMSVEVIKEEPHDIAYIEETKTASKGRGRKDSDKDNALLLDHLEAESDSDLDADSMSSSDSESSDLENHSSEQVKDLNDLNDLSDLRDLENKGLSKDEFAQKLRAMRQNS